MNAELSVADLRFAYTRGAEELFDGLTHRFTPGAVTALTGPSGRGKSTLLYVLGLMLTPSAGVVRLGDVEASALPDRRRARLRATSVGFVFQDAELDPSRPILDSVVEPGLYAGLERQTLEDRARALLERFGLAHRADHRPGQVSGGQAQRVAVCRALVNAPVVVLDEATSALDTKSERLVQAGLERLMRQRTSLIIAHRLATIRHADRIVVMEDGAVVEEGTHTELTARGGLYDFAVAQGEAGDWRTLAEGVDGKLLSTRVAGGFVGAVFGPFAQSEAAATP